LAGTTHQKETQTNRLLYIQIHCFQQSSRYYLQKSSGLHNQYIAGNEFARNTLLNLAKSLMISYCILINEAIIWLVYDEAADAILLFIWKSSQ
jgi:hypothetical protein